MPSLIAKFNRVMNLIANYTIIHRASKTRYNNLNAPGAIVATLPSALAGRTGYDYIFHVATAQSLTIAVNNGTDQVCLPSTGVPGTAGKGLVSSTIGSTVHLEVLTDGIWAVTGYSGTWTAQP